MQRSSSERIYPRIIFIPCSFDGYLIKPASERIRCDWVAPIIKADIFDGFQDLESYDVIIYQKAYVSSKVREIAERYRHKLQIFDITDAEHYFRAEGVKYMIDRCKVITVPTEDLAQDLRKCFDIPVQVIPDRQNLSVYKNRREHQDIEPTFVWFGYADNFHIVESLIYGGLSIEEVENNLLIISERPVGMGRFVKWIFGTSNDEIIRGDIVLNPKWKFKSNNKTTTAWALGLPVAQTVDDIERLRDYKERVRESEEKLKEVEKSWDVRLSEVDWMELIKSKTEVEK